MTIIWLECFDICQASTPVRKISNHILLVRVDRLDTSCFHPYQSPISDHRNPLGLMTVCEVLLCVLRFGKTAAAPELMWRQKKHHAQHHQFRVSHSFYAYSGQQSNPAAADLKTSSFLSNSDHTFDFHYIDR